MKFQTMILFYKEYQKKIHIALGVIVALMALIISIPFATSQIFYYVDKDTGRLIEERKHVKNLKPQTNLQNLLREYLDGSYEYRAHLPFNHVTQLLNANHDAKNKTLVLNWDVYFAAAMALDYFDEDIYYLFKTIKKNTPVQKVYFLLNGHQTSIYWRGQDLSKGFSLTDLK